ncbi:hypothetical protein KIW84_051575, partial [Lathyrus oleraceus]
MNLKLVTTLTLCYVIYICKSNAIDPCASQPDNSDLNVIPMYGKCSPFNPPKTDSWDNRIINMASKDPARMNYLSTLVAQKTVSSSPIASGQAFNIGNYVVRVKIGTPGQLLFMVLDTSTDEAFVPSSGCTGCSATTFSPNSSTSYLPLDCSVPQCGQVRGLSCPATSSGVCSFNQSYAGIEDNKVPETIQTPTNESAENITPKNESENALTPTNENTIVEYLDMDEFDLNKLPALNFGVKK